MANLLAVIKLWMTVLMYSAVVAVRLLKSLFTMGFQKFFQCERVARPACLDDPALGTHGYLHLEDVRLHYVASGPEDRPLMLFLHGFPEFWYSWRHQIKEFQRDYRVVAIDMRGYNRSDKPQDLAAYGLPTLTADIKQVILALGYKSCILVAHDWGAGVAWTFARLYPDLVEKLIVMNAPPTPVISRLMATDPEQKKRSWYIFVFQLPYFPELMLKHGNLAGLQNMWRTMNLTQEELAAYRHVYSQPGALTPPINYYRAWFGKAGGEVTYDLAYTMPVLLIWGLQDVAMSKANPDIIQRENPNIVVKRIATGTHFIQTDQPETVNRTMREWLER